MEKGNIGGILRGEKYRARSLDPEAQRPYPPSPEMGRSSPIMKVALLFSFACVQISFILIATGFISTKNSRLSFGNTGSSHIGHILFIGDMRGTVLECIDCTGRKEILPRLSSILRAYKGALIFDVGGFTAKSNYEASIAVYKKFYDRINISGVNLTKGDYLNIKNLEYIRDIPLISTNLKSNSMIFSQYRSYTLSLQGKMARKEYDFNIVGLSDNLVYPHSGGDIVVENEIISLNRITQSLKGDIIVLYYNSEYCLESLLNRWTGPKPRLVIGCYAGTKYDTIKYIKGIPYTYIGVGLNNIGRLTVRQYGERIKLEYDAVQFGAIFPEDIYVRNILELSRR